MDGFKGFLELMMATEALKRSDLLPALMAISEPGVFEAFIAGLVSTYRTTHKLSVDDEIHMYEEMMEMVKATEGDE